MCFTYILYSKLLDIFYICHTCEELSERLRKHNTNHKGFTSKANDWKLVFTQEFNSKSEAYQFELKLKSWKSRIRIEKLVRGASGG